MTPPEFRPIRHDEFNPAPDYALDSVMVSEATFDTPQADVTVSVHRWVEATTQGIPFTAAEHANAVFEQHGPDVEHHEPVDGIEYHINESVTTHIHGQGEPETQYSALAHGTPSPEEGIQEILNDHVDWAEYFDPAEYDLDTPELANDHANTQQQQRDTTKQPSLIDAINKQVEHDRAHRTPETPARDTPER